MISVLLPSRGRPAALTASLQSLTDTADAPGDLEFLVAADPDDTATQEAVRGIPAATLLVTTERYGYARLHEYFNRLADAAHGEWLLTWNDDAAMRTQGWDTVIRAQSPGVLWPSANHHPGNNMFPIWPSAWTRAMGHVSLCFNYDTWMQFVGDGLGLQWKIPVEIFHDRHNVTGSGNFNDQVAAEGTEQADKTASVLFSMEMTAERERDVARIRELLP